MLTNHHTFQPSGHYLISLGHVLVIEQAVGHCGGSEARTDKFRISHQDEDGYVVSQRVHRFLDIQTFMAEVHDATDNLRKT